MKEADVAIIKANIEGKKIRAFALADEPETGNDVFIIAHPTAYLYYFSSGIVNRLHEDRGSLFSRKIEISADYAAGSSGGPIFDNKGNIIGFAFLK